MAKDGVNERWGSERDMVLPHPIRSSDDNDVAITVLLGRSQSIHSLVQCVPVRTTEEAEHEESLTCINSVS